MSAYDTNWQTSHVEKHREMTLSTVHEYKNDSNGTCVSQKLHFTFDEYDFLTIYYRKRPKNF